MSKNEIQCEGGCRDSGMCPGVALLISGLVAIVLHKVTHWDWIFFPVLGVLTPILVFGLHKTLLPFRKKTENPSN